MDSIWVLYSYRNNIVILYICCISTSLGCVVFYLKKKLCYSAFTFIIINVSTKRWKGRPMLRQVRKITSTWPLILHVRIANDTQKIQSSDWPKMTLSVITLRKLTYRQTAGNDVRCPTKMRQFALRHMYNVMLANQFVQKCLA